MRITGGQITGGITFSSPEIPTITRWAFTESGANVDWGIGNWDEYLGAGTSVRLDYGNSYLYTTVNSINTGYAYYGVNETANTFADGTPGVAGIGGRLSNAEILAIFEALPVGSRIDYSLYQGGANVVSFSYTGGAYLGFAPYGFDGGGNIAYQLEIRIPIEGTNGNVIETMQAVYGSNIYHNRSSTSGQHPYGPMLVYHPANVYDILAVTGSDITRWVFSEAGADFHFGVGNWDKQLFSIHSVEADYANSRLILETSWTVAAYGADETANVFMSGVNPSSGVPALSNAEALAIFQALPVGSRIDFNKNAEGNTEGTQNLTYSGDVSGNILSTYYRVPAISIPVSGLYANSAGRLGGIRVHHPANVYDILAVTGPDTTANVGITRWVFSEDSPDFHFGEGNWDKYMASTRAVEADSANGRIILNIYWTGSLAIHDLFDETANAFLSGFNTNWNSPVLSNAEALAIFQALPVGSRIDFNHNATANLSTIQTLTYSGNTSFFLQYGTQPSLSIPVEGLDTNNIFLLGGIRVHHPGNVYDILAVTGGDSVQLWGITANALSFDNYTDPITGRTGIDYLIASHRWVVDSANNSIMTIGDSFADQTVYIPNFGYSNRMPNSAVSSFLIDIPTGTRFTLFEQQERRNNTYGEPGILISPAALPNGNVVEATFVSGESVWIDQPHSFPALGPERVIRLTFNEDLTALGNICAILGRYSSNMLAVLAGIEEWD